MNSTLTLTTPSGKPVILTLDGAAVKTISIDGGPAVKADKIGRVSGRVIIKSIPGAKSIIDAGHDYCRVEYTSNGKTCQCLLDKPSGGQLQDAINAHYAAVKAERDARLAVNVPGLDVLRAAIDDWRYYHERFRRAMEDEYNDGVRMPCRPTSDIDALSVQYPRAALWITADSYEDAANYHKSSAGRRAKAMIEAGEPLDAAQGVLDNWLPDSAMWD